MLIACLAVRFQAVGDNVTEGRRDMHEAFDLYREGDGRCALVRDGARGAGMLPHDSNPWPAEHHLPGFRAALEEAYVGQMLALGGRLSRGLALGLGLAERFFEPAFDRSFWVLRLIRYPPPLSQNNAAAPGSGGGSAGGNGNVNHDDEALGCGRHTDYGNAAKH